MNERPLPFRGSGPFLQYVPKPSLPLRHFAFAALSFWTFAAALAWRGSSLVGFDFEFPARWALGLVHTLTLGWIAMTILGVLSQMIPAHNETPLAWPRVVGAGWWLLAVGLCVFVGLLWSGSNAYWLGAACAACGVLLYLAGFGRTLLRAKRLDWPGLQLAIGLGYLALLATLGVLLAYDGSRGMILRDHAGALIAHLHLALVGWVSLSIFGASYRLVPLFSMARLRSKTPGRLALALVNAGLLGLAVDSLFFGHRLLGLWAIILTAGYAVYAGQAARIFVEGSKGIDASLAFTFLALFGGLVWCALGLALAFGGLKDTMGARAAYVWTVALGWATPFILGQIHKIAPFLIWLHVYSPRQWAPPVQVPKIDELRSGRLMWAEFAAFAPAYLCGLAGFLESSSVLMRAAGLLMLLAATLSLANMGLTFSHLVKPRPRWAPPKP